MSAGGSSQTATLLPKEDGDESSPRWRSPTRWPWQWWCAVGAVATVLLAVALWLLGLPAWISRAAGEGSSAVPAWELTDKPRNDARAYQYVQLANGLHVLNVQDSLTLKTSFAVSVMAGSFDDPKELPGLAHFCEHMLFLGTGRYPVPSDFDNFISRNAGSDNAYTAPEVTVYYGEVTQKASEEALDRFGDFFRGPLFDRRFVKKEVNAIESEHAKNVQSSSRRIMEVMNALADPRSPVSRFHTGNLETLYDGPKREGLDPVGALQDYFNTHYCPERMRLVTLGSAPLKEQLEMAVKFFADIPPGNSTCAQAPRSFASPAPFPLERMGKWLTIEGTQPQPGLWIHFPLPDVSHDFKSQPLSYIDYVMSYRGENSLARTLQDGLGLVSSFQTTYDISSAGTNLYFVATLTSFGQQHPELLLDVLFSYIVTLQSKGVNTDLYQTIADVAKLKWDWASTPDTLDTVSDLAERMTRLPPENLLSGDDRIDQLDPALVASLLRRLTPDNMNVALVVPPGSSASALEGVEVHELPHYGVRYTIRQTSHVVPGGPTRWRHWQGGQHHGMTEDLAHSVQAAGASSAVALPPQPPRPILDVPKHIPLDHARAAETGSAATVEQQLFGPRPDRLPAATLLGGTELRGASARPSTALQVVDPQMWYRSGWVTSSPKVQLQLALRPLRTPSEVDPSVGDMVNLAIYSRLLREEMTPRLVDLMATGVVYGIDVSPSGLSFSFSGFAPVLPRLVTTVLAEFNSFNLQSNPTKVERFDRIKQQVGQELATFGDMPVSYAVQDRSLLLTRGPYSRAESLAALQEVTLESAVKAAGHVLLARPLQLTGLALGNMKGSDALQLARTFATGIEVPPGVTLLSGDGQLDLVAPVVNPSQPVEVRAPNPRAGDPNDVVSVSLLYGVATVPSRVQLGLIGQILSVLAYNELRTTRQLGYVVSAGVSTVSNVQYVSAVVQGTVLRADEAEAAIEHVFNELMPKRLATLTDEEFQTYLSSFEQGLLQPPMAPSEEVDHFWGPVKQGGRCFELRTELLRYLDSSAVSKESLLQTWAALATPKQGPRKKVVVKYFAGTPPPVPTLAQANATWFTQGVPASAVPMLTLEREHTLVLDRVDSAVRKELADKGSYYPQELQCTLQPGDLPAAASSRKAAGGQTAFLGPR